MKGEIGWFEIFCWDHAYLVHAVLCLVMCMAMAVAFIPVCILCRRAVEHSSVFCTFHILCQGGFQTLFVGF